MQVPDQKRRRKLIKPGLQLWMTLTFVGMSALALMLQFVLFLNRMTSVALQLPNDSAILAEKTPELVTEVFLISCLLFLPLVFTVGILTTFRVAGPVHRMEMELRRVIRGEKTPDFRLRNGDRLHELAALINEATAPLRTTEAEAADSDLEDVTAPLPSAAAEPARSENA